MAASPRSRIRRSRTNRTGHLPTINSFSQQVSCNYHALNLRSALVNLQQLRVTHQLFDRVLLHVAVTAENLHGVGCDLHARIGAEGLCVTGGNVRTLALIHQPRRLVSQQAHRFDLDCHIRHHELDRLEIGDRLAERGALLGVFETLVEGALADSNRDRPDLGAAAIERGHRILEALSLAANQRGGGYTCILVEDFRGVRRPLAEFPVHPPSRNSRRGGWKYEAGNSLVLKAPV